MDKPATTFSRAASTPRLIVYYMLVTSLVILTFLALYHLMDYQSSSSCIYQAKITTTGNPPSPSCGSSPADALSAGCFFDPMNLAWQAPACHNSELIQKFSETFNNDSGFLTEVVALPGGRRTSPLTANEVGETTILHVNRAFLRLQCKFRWTELTQALENGQPIHSLLRDESWALQCQDLLLDEDAEKATGLSPVVVAFPICF